MNDNILDMELNEEQAVALKESLESWKEGVYAELSEESDARVQKKFEELEEASIAYKEQLKDEYADKMIEAINDMRTEIKAEVVSEMVSNDPSYQILEEIKKLIAPTLNEEYLNNVFGEEINTLREQVEAFKRDKELEEGLEEREALIENCSEEVKALMRTFIGEGTVEEIRDRYWEIAESLETFNGEEYEEYEDEEGEEEDGEEEETEREESSSTEDEEDEEEGEVEEDTKPELSPFKKSILEILND